jgi:DNA-3-methyladenine glycosylase II
VTTSAVRAAERELATRDPVLAGLVAAAGPCALGGRAHPSHFEALARSIVFQQLATRAATAIWARTRALVPGRFTPEAVVALPVDALRSAGLSGAKARSVSDLAAHVVAGDVRLGRVARLRDDEIVADLSKVWGIGTWTAQMFLMFQLGRLDVWPVLDLGVRSGYARAWGTPTLLAKELEPLGEPFRPYRSIAAWYCWRALEL